MAEIFTRPRNRKAWLDYLFYDVGQQQFDFYVSGLIKQDDETISTKWKKYSEVVFPVDFDKDWKLEWINQRQIFPHEIVLDVEDIWKLDPILKKLPEFATHYWVFLTGSRGAHVHCFFNRNLPEEQKRIFIKYFDTDSMKVYEKTMIALEFAKHWKTGNQKELLYASWWELN